MLPGRRPLSAMIAGCLKVMCCRGLTWMPESGGLRVAPIFPLLPALLMYRQLPVLPVLRLLPVLPPVFSMLLPALSLAFRAPRELYLRVSVLSFRLLFPGSPVVCPLIAQRTELRAMGLRYRGSSGLSSFIPTAHSAIIILRSSRSQLFAGWLMRGERYCGDNCGAFHVVAFHAYNIFEQQYFESGNCLWAEFWMDDMECRNERNGSDKTLPFLVWSCRVCGASGRR